MKKTLAAVAVLGAFAGSALAADVTLYGKVDLGLNYTHTDVDGVSSDNWGMKSGQNSGSRFGIKGTEQISEGLTVGFQLENGFDADDGRFKYGNDDGERIFGREARVFVQTDFGELGFGRMGGLDSGSGSYDIFGGNAGVFGTGWSGIGSDSAIFLGMSSRYDNMITYKSPTFAGVTVLAQVSLAKTSVEEGEGSSDVDRYYALGATGNWGALSSALIFSTTDYSRTWVNGTTAEEKENAKEDGHEDMSKVLTGYVSYDFGVVKPMLAAQYFDDLKGMSVSAVLDEGAEVDGLNKYLGSLSKKGYGVILGATAPLGAGTLFASVGYNDFESTVSDDVDGKIKFDTVQFGIGYQYPLSKRTYVYTAAGYTKLSGDFKEDGKKYDPETKTTEVVAGIVHNF